MRFVHMTDVHYFVPPPWSRILNKRILGLANLYLAGRSSYFDAGAGVAAAVGDAEAQGAEAFLFTGDLTATGLPAEFDAARSGFAPLLTTLPSVVIPGNHDRYTGESSAQRQMEAVFAPWMGGGTWDPERMAYLGVEAGPGPRRFRIGPIDVIATDPCRPGLRAMGRYPPGAILQAERLVRESREAGRFCIYLLHYPVLDADGSPYRRAGHHLHDLDELIGSLRRAPPDMVLHGHQHRCWRVELKADGGRTVPIWNCGSTSARTGDPDRAAGFFVFDVEGAHLRAATRRILRDGTFGPHPRLDWAA